MRDLFPGYYEPSADDFSHMWHHGTFVVDANVLLDVYRYSDETVTQLLNTLERLRPRLWIPYQAAWEYHNNIARVIASQQRPYQTALDGLAVLKAAFVNTNEHPFLEAELLNETLDLFDRLQNTLTAKRNLLSEMLVRNPAKARVAAIFEGRVGASYTTEILDAIHREGADRYSRKVPPGYEDAKDKPEPDRYGDLVLWKQIIDKARQSDAPIVFITRDVKEDWFLRVSGKTIGPRPELIAELRSASGVGFHIYTTTSFLQYANEHLEAGVPQEAIEEIRHNQLAVSDSELTRQTLVELSLEAYIRRELDDETIRLDTLHGVPGQNFVVGFLSDGRKLIVNRYDPEVFLISSRTPEGIVVDHVGPALTEYESIIGDAVLPGGALHSTIESLSTPPTSFPAPELDRAMGLVEFLRKNLETAAQPKNRDETDEPTHNP